MTDPQIAKCCAAAGAENLPSEMMEILRTASALGPSFLRAFCTGFWRGLWDAARKTGRLGKVVDALRAAGLVAASARNKEP